jgi:chromosome segregation ATPase
MPKKSFYLTGAAVAEITGLETELSEMNARHSEIHATMTSSIESLTSELSAAAIAIESLDSQVESLTAAKDLAESRISDFDSKVELAVSSRFASLGGNPVQSSNMDESQSSKQKAGSGLSGLALATAIHKAKNLK